MQRFWRPRLVRHLLVSECIVLWSNFGNVAIDELMKGGAFSLDVRSEYASVDC